MWLQLQALMNVCVTMMAYTRLNVLVTARESRRGVGDSSSFRGSWCRTGDGIHGVIYHTPPPAPQEEGQLNATSAPVRRHRQMSTNSTPTPVGRHFSKENICNPNFALMLTHMEPNDAWAAVRRQRGSTEENIRRLRKLHTHTHRQ